MLELDLILVRFLSNKSLTELTNQQMDELEKLLDCSDPDILSWLMNTSCVVDSNLRKAVATVQQYSKF